MERILIVEDDIVLANGIALALKSNDVQIEQCTNLRTAKQKVEEVQYDLLILDINLPDGNGLDFLQEVKSRKGIAVILLTANDMEIDIVTGLESGADDYVTKPFSLAVLRARVHAQLRKNVARQNYFQQDSFSFDFERMEFKKADTYIELSKTEQKLLRIFTANKGIILERKRLLDYVWSDAEYVDENALSVSVKRLRDKLEDTPMKPQYIKTVYGIGYMWEAGK